MHAMILAIPCIYTSNHTQDHLLIKSLFVFIPTTNSHETKQYSFNKISYNQLSVDKWEVNKLLHKTKMTNFDSNYYYSNI
jgi:hypothetical protein